MDRRENARAKLSMSGEETWAGSVGLVGLVGSGGLVGLEGLVG
jgi:hypothetical protein